MKLEVCIDSYESFKNSKIADRVEICSALSLDGLSPSVGLISLIEKEKDIEKFVMIRPREGDFFYNDQEFETMKEEIKILKNYDIDGFVFGILDNENRLDIKRMKELIDLAYPLKSSIHRAVDVAVDFKEKIPELIDIGFIRILTSGQKDKAYQGLDLINNIQKKYGDKIEIMAGSGLSFENIREVYEKTYIENFHLSGRVYKENGGEGGHYIASHDLVKKAKDIVDSLE